MCSLSDKKLVSKDDDIFYYRSGWGKDEKGAFWGKGDYEWHAFVDGELVGTASFHIEDMGAPSAFSNPWFDVVSVKLYSGKSSNVDEGKRKYLTMFNRETTEYIWTELKIRNKVSDGWNCELFFHFTDDAGQAKGSMVKQDFIERGQDDEIFTMCKGWGADNAGSWKDDKYFLNIVFMDVAVARVSFEVSNIEIEGEPAMLSMEECAGIPGGSSTQGEEEVVDPMAALESLIGLDEVKRQVKEHISYLEFLKIRKEKGFEETGKMSLHGVFTGNPGTGKTTVVKLLGKIYKNIGLLSKGHVHEVGRADLVGKYIGQTAPLTKKAIDDARGGILFIDEAYSLAREGDSNLDYGKEVIEVLLKEMSDGKGDIAIMVAGYPHEMNVFLSSNPGLRSRFNYTFHFEDYKPLELMQILDFTAAKKGVSFAAEARRLTEKAIIESYRNRDKSFGNARFAVSIVSEAKMNMGIRIMNSGKADEMSEEELSTVLLDDVQKIFASTLKTSFEAAIDEELVAASLNELNSLTGLENIKTELAELTKLIRYYRETGREVTNKMSLHSVFSGNPGTGKTTVARICGKIFKALGLLERGHVVEADREGLVAAYLGQTALKTKARIDEAQGGVLFIDEAYALTEDDRDTFGGEAIEVLLKNMEDLRGKFIVIVAGYTNEMKRFLNSNPGLSSRFDRTFEFVDFEPEELYQISLRMLGNEFLEPDTLAATHLKAYFNSLYQTGVTKTGNARIVRKVVEEAVRNQNLRMASVAAAQRTPEMIRTLTFADVEEFVPRNEAEKKGLGFQYGSKQ
ncbi:MAG: AAA family ATPase [Bacteroidetes bacterium]|nr:AAA family ATPase [Bacteroidota bacterium]MBU1719446.1 AAA family ATPase [Bacteroidota bacterium]